MEKLLLGLRKRERPWTGRALDRRPSDWKQRMSAYKYRFLFEFRPTRPLSPVVLRPVQKKGQKNKEKKKTLV